MKKYLGIIGFILSFTVIHANPCVKLNDTLRVQCRCNMFLTHKGCIAKLFHPGECPKGTSMNDKRQCIVSKVKTCQQNFQMLNNRCVPANARGCAHAYPDESDGNWVYTGSGQCAANPR
jgi:hypothetical protein